MVIRRLQSKFLQSNETLIIFQKVFLFFNTIMNWCRNLLPLIKIRRLKIIKID
jgi:hypothetical protein